MASHTLGSREEWLAARLELLEAEKELTRRNDELARQRRDPPWVHVEKNYQFATEDGDESCAICSCERSQLLVITSCSGQTGRKDVRAVLRSPTVSPAALRISTPMMSRSSWCRVRRSMRFVAYKRRMGWDFR